MDELVKALGFRVIPHGSQWQIQYVVDGKVTRVVPCAYPAIWALWEALLDRSGLLPSEA